MEIIKELDQEDDVRSPDSPGDEAIHGGSVDTAEGLRTVTFETADKHGKDMGEYEEETDEIGAYTEDKWNDEDRQNAEAAVRARIDAEKWSQEDNAEERAARTLAQWQDDGVFGGAHQLSDEARARWPSGQERWDV